MNNPLVDEIQALADCRSHAERADWLLTVPLSVLSHYEMTIRNRLQIAGFHEGVDYLEWELRRFRSRRYDGDPPHESEHPRVVMSMWSIGELPAMVAASAPDHGLTDL